MTSNRVTLLRAAAENLEAMPPEAERQARGLIVLLAASIPDRLAGRLDSGFVNVEGRTMWGYQADDFWLFYIENDDGSLRITNIWQR